MGALPFVPGVVAVAGSRSLPPGGGSALVGRVACELLAGGCLLAVGCCVGADASLLAFALAVPGSRLGRVRCLCAFGRAGVGAGPVSAVAAVSAFAAGGGSVSWWAGGPASVPLSARLAARTQAVVSSASAGLVVFLAEPGSRGSLLAASRAVSRGLPVVAFPLFPATRLPLLGIGAWVPAGASSPWRFGWRWVPGQGVLDLTS